MPLTPTEARRIARESIIDAVGASSPREASWLVALVEAAAGMCPRRVRVLLDSMVKTGALTRPAAGMIGRGERFASFQKEVA